MSYAGFVLVGGRSARMGRDKALLRYKSKPLLEHAAQQVLSAAGNVTLIGDPALYGQFGYPVYPDRVPGCGPLGGLYTALSRTQADWNLIVACDLPSICELQLKLILEAANEACDCVVPQLKNELTEPLSAAYHRRCLPKVEQALANNALRMRDLIRELSTITLTGWEPELFHNVNSPADWKTIG